MKKKQAWKVMGAVLAGTLVFSDAVPLRASASAGTEKSAVQNETVSGTENGTETKTKRAAVYVNLKTGDDTADGTTAETAVKTVEKAQELLARRSAVIHPRPDIPHTFARKVMCGHCGSLCRRKNCGGSVNWACRKHDKSTTACPNTPVPEEQLKSAFLRLYYKLKHYGSAILTQLISDLHAAKTGSLLWSENIVEINKQISDIASQERLLTQLKQQGSVDPDIFISRGNLLAERRRELKLQKERILRSEEDHTIQQTQDLLDVLESGPDWLDDFDEQLFSDLVEKIEVVDNEKLCFRLLNGLEVTEKIERTQR